MLEGLIRARRVQSAAGATMVPLGEALIRAGLIRSIGTLKTIEAESRLEARCRGCGTAFLVTFHVPDAVHPCPRCGAPLEPDAGAASTAHETLIAPPADAGDTMLGLGTGAAPAPLPSPEESIASGLPAGGGETLLHLNTPARPLPAPEESIASGLPPGGGETLLDLNTPRPAAPPPAEESLATGLPPGGGETLLDLNTPKPGTPVPEATIVVADKPGEASNTGYEPTILATDTPRTRSTSGTRGDSKAGLDMTPRSSTGGMTPRSVSGGVRSTVPTKAAPKEVQEATKDPKRIFGKYVLVKELGRGGAGIVYKAWDTTLHQYVALKFIREQDLSDTGSSMGSQQAIEDFQREARMSAKLRHPNIIRIYELGCMSNRYYLSMDYIEGGSLFEVIHGGKERNTDTTFNVDTKKHLEIFRKICEAVDTAHKHNPPVIHRDLKPHNVLVGTDGTPFVVDFGLAKEVDLTTSQHTMTGVVKGTPSYMAPEQAEGRTKDVDARTDVYSLGAILYEMLTGRPPFAGGSVREVLNAICTKLPDRPNEAIVQALLEKADGPNRPRPVPKPLETICMKALEKAREDRYQSAGELAEDIQRFLKDEDILAQEPGLYRRIRRKIRQHPLVSGLSAAALLCAAVITGALWYTARKGNANVLEPLVATAREHLGASDWAALRTDAENIRKVDPRHPLVAQIENILAAREADLARRRDAWAAGVARVGEGSLGEALLALRPLYRDAGELREAFADQLQRALLEAQNAAENEARELIGAGPREEWLDPAVKQRAAQCRDRIGVLQSLAADADFPFKPSAALAGLSNGLARLLAYQGIWDLRVNVAPYARVTLRRDGRVVAQEWTPVGLRGLEVTGKYQVEVAWPDPEKPAKTVALDLADLRHKATLVLTGDITRSEVKVQP
ncbi:MAG TPA: protein kinase [Planctomycetota bacterium]|nr:protein kinase [Planctomycetota bacterium]